MREHRPQILQIEQQHALLVRNPENDIQNALLDVVQIEQARQKQRPHFRDRGPNRVSLFAENVPEGDGKPVGLVRNANLLGACDEGRLAFARLRQSREIAFDVGEKDAGSGVREAFGEPLQRDGFAAAGCARDQAMAIAKREQKVVVSARLPVRYACADEDFAWNGARSFAHG